jgi:hypothetical protein
MGSVSRRPCADQTGSNGQLLPNLRHSAPLRAKALVIEAGQMLRGLGSPLADEALAQRSVLSTLGTDR